jgi:hypothetical protein
MGGGLMQLVAYGAQDIYLTGNAQITLFKVVYRRHTNFAMESIENVFQGAVGLGKRVTAVIQRNGDLIKDMWLECEFGTVTDAVYGLGNAMVKQVEIEIGGQLIDRQYGEWMNIWSELCVPEGKRVGYDAMVGNYSTGSQGIDGSSHSVGGDTNTVNTKLDVPLWFWFNNNPGLALPLIALQYHEVRVNLELRSGSELSTSTTATLTTCKLWVDYIYLDTDERRRMAQVSHEYLIEQLQFVGNTTAKSALRIDLPLNHPVKELLWVAQPSTVEQPCQFENMVFTDALLKLNGHDRFTARRPEYFLHVQHFKHHTHMPRYGRDTCLVVAVDATDNSSATDAVNLVVAEDNAQYIYCYSFALNPEDHQPSGTCNFSRIDNASLHFTGLDVSGNTNTVKVFARNYNVLRIMSGMAGVAYSN